ncbi:MAG: serine hydrolase [Prolixibacteraceae bacterium]|jgi:CubicO group peptidase (beta-lactamase class C family)|nr:serine hydrolase [Prolixibacteraceae bacterium]MBT6763869.1 serine hydrolase [Prolixibacteraceae bacterium]MBT6999461.1 serine hydrolase [Prolixibacteraceae bacterium]MBT7394782.1 serine hydrolase [Prolixibacteraceae bacterium]
MKKRIIFIITIVSILSCSYPSEKVFPKDKWLEVKPEEVGIDSQTLNKAVNFLKLNSGRNGIDELMIIRNGRLIFKGDSVDKVHGVWSCTKSFTSTVLGLLIDDNKTQLNTLAKTILPEMAVTYPEVNLFHFSTMTSGYKAVGDTATTGYTHGSSSTPFSPGSPPLFEPGTKYAYWDAAMNQFANILTHIATEPLDEFFKHRIADPIGMNEKAWKWLDFGEIDGLKVVGGAGNKSNGIYISANELARFGLLFLNEGNWDGTQLISSDWIKQATKNQVPVKLELGSHLSETYGMGVYGYNWWVNGIQANGARLWPNAPEGTYAASGHNNNKMFIINEWNMVIVRLGLDAKDVTISDSAWNEFLGKIRDSLKNR